ncbi:unnamed protein product, partial [marine sediment metagenome]
MESKMNLVGIVLKDESPRTREPSNTLITYLKSKSIEYFVIVSKEGVIEERVREKIPNSDLCVTFGGDGTLLYAARIFSQHGVPI